MCIADFCLKATLFLTTDVDNENMYWKWSGRIFNHLNSGQQVSVYTAFIIILIILFCILKIELLYSVLLYTSQSHQYLNFKLGDNNQIQTDQYLHHIMLGSPQIVVN
jgi:preprotein translocase subunit SecY